MNLNNYSADDALDEWANDRSRAPLLLAHAVELNGLEWTITAIMRRGFRRAIVIAALREANLMERPQPKPHALSEDPAGDLFRRAWKLNPQRVVELMNEVATQIAE